MYHGKAIKRGILVSFGYLLKNLFHKIYLPESNHKLTCKSQVPTFIQTQKILHNHYKDYGGGFYVIILKTDDYFLLRARSTFTAQATEQPTMGLLPMPRKPIISTCAGTEEEPAN